MNLHVYSVLGKGDVFLISIMLEFSGKGISHFMSFNSIEWLQYCFWTNTTARGLFAISFFALYRNFFPGRLFLQDFRFLSV